MSDEQKKLQESFKRLQMSAAKTIVEQIAARQAVQVVLVEADAYGPVYRFVCPACRRQQDVRTLEGRLCCGVWLQPTEQGPEGE